MTALDKDRVDAEAFVESNLNRYWNWFLEELDDQRARGIIPFFSVPDRTRKAFAVRHEELRSSEDAAMVRQGVLCSCRPAVLARISALNDRQYEALSCLLCRSIGAVNVYLTPPGGEGGIDFVANIMLASKSHIFSGMGREFRLIGQSKKYETRVSVDRIDQFLRTMENVRGRSKRVSDQLPVWFDVSAGPIIGWMISHSGFQSGSSNEAKQHGLILSDTLDVTETLSLADSFYATSTAAIRAAQLALSCDAIITEFQ